MRLQAPTRQWFASLPRHSRAWAAMSLYNLAHSQMPARGIDSLSSVHPTCIRMQNTILPVKYSSEVYLHGRPQEDRGNEAISTGSANTQGSHPSQGANQPNQTPSSAPAQPQQQQLHTVGCVRPPTWWRGDGVLEPMMAESDDDLFPSCGQVLLQRCLLSPCKAWGHAC